MWLSVTEYIFVIYGSVIQFAFIFRGTFILLMEVHDFPLH